MPVQSAPDGSLTAAQGQCNVGGNRKAPHNNLAVDRSAQPHVPLDSPLGVNAANYSVVIEGVGVGVPQPAWVKEESDAQKGI